MKKYWEKIKIGGMLAGHDYDETKPERVKRSVEKFSKLIVSPLCYKINEREKVGDWWIWK